MALVARSREFIGHALLVVTALGWSGAWITARAAADELAPLTVTLGRFVLASIALLPVWAVTERRARLRLTRREGAIVVGMALTGIIAYTVLFLLGMQRSPASAGAVIVPGLAGVWSIAFAWLFLRERPKGREVAGAGIALAGIALVGLSALRTAASDPERIQGDLILAMSAATWGAYTILGRRLAERIGALTAVLYASTLGALLLVPIVLVVDGVPDPRAWSGLAWTNVVYLGVVATAVSFVTYYMGVRMVGVQRMAPTLGLVPFFAVIEAAAILGERLTPLHAVGGALVILGILWPMVREARRRRMEAVPVPEVA